ncbi:MAG TPA: hypothetical protein VJ484_10615 [Lysobacter sp.]|jgi:hypothetical protein|nr:hypothetical protein [Lysobacter sp.]
MATSKRVVPRDTPRQLGGGLSQKRFDSESIREHLAAFERNGGRIEKLGTTRVLQKIDGETVATPPAPKRKR